MDEWVHCNLCGQALSKGIQFFLTTCSHIFCGRCKDKGTNPVCAICKAPCKAKELNEKLDANMQTYFSSPIKQNEKFIQICKFQAQHRTLFIKHMKQKIEQQSKIIKTAEEYFVKLKEENKQLKYDLSILKKYIYSYKAHSSGHSHQRPITPRQLTHSPSMMSPMQSRSRTQSPMVTGGAQSHTSSKWMARSPTSKHLVEIQNTPDVNRISIRAPPSDGVLGTPSPRSALKSGSAYPARSNSPLVVSSEKVYRHSASFNPKPSRKMPSLDTKLWPTPPCTPKHPASVQSSYFSKVDQTPPCTPRHHSFVSQPPTRESTPMLKFYKTNFR